MDLPAQLEPGSAWREIRARLRQAVGESSYEIWLAPLELKAWDGAILLLQAPPATQSWVTKHFGAAIEKCAQAVIGEQAHVSFTGRDDQTAARIPSTSRQRESLPGLNPRYNFDQFIIGDGNRLAHAAALAVAEQPGQAYNPLFLHAPPGLGKTHLLHAIGNYVLHFGGSAAIRYATVEAFTNHFIAALGSRSLDHFKHVYRDADVLLLDDVQFLANKAKTEEEFFHTFNALYDNGRQLVLTCDRLPRQLLGVEERLRERFEAGLVADIEPPDFATRLTILRKRARLDGIRLTNGEVLELIAERVTDNVRALEGALIRIVAHHSLTGRPLDRNLAADVLDEIHPPVGRGAVTITSIQQAVARHYGLSVAELLSSSRTARLSWPRQLAVHLARELTGSPLQVIGEAFGGRSHATVLHACKRVAERVASDADADHELRDLIALITAD